MNATEDETLIQPQEQIEEQLEEEQPQPEPAAPIRPLAQARADLEKQLSDFKAFVAELESTQARSALILSRTCHFEPRQNERYELIA